MASTWTSERFPQFEADIRRLTEEHRELEDEPLHLAITYSPSGRNQEDIYLFEVIGGPFESVSSERDLFEVTFTASTGFPMRQDQQLHLILTNQTELQVAIEQGWPIVREVADAIRKNEYKVLFADDVGRGVYRQLQTSPATLKQS